MKNINEPDDALSKFIGTLNAELTKNDFIQMSFDDFMEFIPYYNGEYKIDEESIKYLAEYFEKFSIETEPRIRKGITKHRIDSPILLYKCTGQFDHKTVSYRNGFLVVRMAVIMALSDGVASDAELKKIKRIIWGFNFLTLTEKKALYVKANYLVLTKNHVEDNYRRIAINRIGFIAKLPEVSQSTSMMLLNVAMDIAIADGVILQAELRLLKDMYKALDMSVRSAEPDLRKYADNQFIKIRQKDEEELFDENQLDEVDDILGDLIMDFDDI